MTRAACLPPQGFVYHLSSHWSVPMAMEVQRLEAQLFRMRALLQNYDNEHGRFSVLTDDSREARFSRGESPVSCLQ